MTDNHLSDFASWAAIISTSILALAAIFAFLLQRARYLRETNVTLRLLGNVPRTEQSKSGSTIIITRTTIENPSNTIHMTAEPPELSRLKGVPTDLQSAWRVDDNRLHPLPPPERINYEFRMEVPSTKIVQLNDYDFELDLTIKAVGQFDFVTLLFKPLSFGRRKYRRKLQVSGRLSRLDVGRVPTVNLQVKGQFRDKPRSRNFVDQISM